MKKALLIFFLISSVCISHAQFICNNIPPVAIAGNDTTIQNNQASCTPVPVTITLNGNRSYDQDGIIVSYLWTGPYGVTNPNAAITTVMGLTPGNHSFILKVTDNNGAFAYDTFHISIVPANRPLIPARLIPIGTLSQGRGGVTVAAAGNKLVFAGGGDPVSCATASVDIFDISTRIWTTSQLSQARIGMGTAVLGNKIFFAGGYVPLPGPPGPPSMCYITNWDNTRSSAVDIYDASTNNWSISQLSSARSPVGTSAGGKVVFAGGDDSFCSSEIDIYDSISNSWSASLLSESRHISQPAVAGNKIFFGGGSIGLYTVSGGDLSKQLDIYDASTNTWSVDTLYFHRGEMASISVNNKIYWAGGYVWNSSHTDFTITNNVEIRDLTNNTTSFDCLYAPKASIVAIKKSNKICFFREAPTVFYAPDDKFDIYDFTTDTWAIGILPQNLTSPVFVSYNDSIYVTEGSQVWKLEIDSCTNSSSSIITASACDVYTLNGKTYTRSGMYTQKLTNAGGCDSIITINLTINYSANCTMSITACDSYTWQGQTYTNSGLYSDTLISSNGCDSIVNLQLTLNPPTIISINASICPGQNYAGYTTGGIYIDTLIAANGCDSVRTVNLVVNPILSSTINASICPGQFYAGYTTGGTYIDTLVASNGCDSVRTIHLVLNPTSSSTITQSICQGQTFLGYGTSGTYIDTLAGANGCDSMRTVYLTVYPAYSAFIDTTICYGQSFEGHNSSATYINKFTSISGCDSVRTVQLMVLPQINPTLGKDTSVCPGNSIILYPGQYTNYLWQDGSSQSHLIVKQPGFYSVTVTDNCGSAQDEILIKGGFCDIYFPSAFTPNNDGKNDLFKIPDVYHISNYRLVVYSRWGQKVFETTNPSKGWNGEVNGKPQNTGAFAWHCEYRKPGITDLVKMKGTVMLVR